jgi:hypothetical protein
MNWPFRREYCHAISKGRVYEILAVGPWRVAGSSFSARVCTAFCLGKPCEVQAFYLPAGAEIASQAEEAVAHAGRNNFCSGY